MHPLIGFAIVVVVVVVVIVVGAVEDDQPGNALVMTFHHLAPPYLV
jgi:hypothetical protein